MRVLPQWELLEGLLGFLQVIEVRAIVGDLIREGLEVVRDERRRLRAGLLVDLDADVLHLMEYAGLDLPARRAVPGPVVGREPDDEVGLAEVAQEPAGLLA